MNLQDNCKRKLLEFFPKGERASSPFLFPGLFTLLASLLGLSWLLPNHYFPWPTAWQDGLIIALTCALSLLIKEEPRLPRIELGIIVIIISTAILQWALDIIFFRADVILTVYYATLLMLSVRIGCAITLHKDEKNTNSWTYSYHGGLVIAATISVGIALVQFARIPYDAAWIASLPQGGRPFSNLAQPNHFSTACVIGLCCAGHLNSIKKIRNSIFYITIIAFALGISISDSRTGVLQLLVALSILVVVSFKSRDKAAGKQFTVLLLSLLLFKAFIPYVTPFDAYVRPVEVQLNPGKRIEHWEALSGACLTSPFLGYGWGQVNLAQQVIAVNYPPAQEHITYAHNVFLDLCIWTGLPIGVLLSALLIIVAARRIKQGISSTHHWHSVLILSALVHAALEYPHTYAYFMIPLGITLGILFSTCKTEPGFKLSRKISIPLSSAAVLLGLSIAVEYLYLEEAFRSMRLRSARIGSIVDQSQASQNIHILDNLSTLLRISKLMTNKSLQKEDLSDLARVTKTFGHPPLLFRYAVLLALNSRATEAEEVLRQLCHVHPKERCLEGLLAWKSLEKIHPTMKLVNYPQTYQ